MESRRVNTQCLVFLLLLPLAAPLHAAEEVDLEKVTEDLQVVRGAVDGALLRRGGKTLAIYGDPRDEPASVEMVLFTHHRRDVVWAGRSLVASGAQAVVPAAEVAEFSQAHKFWSEFAQSRFHDYAQQSTKVLGEPIPVAKSVQEGEILTWEGLPIRMLHTPGYTRGAVTYVVELDGRRIAFTGDLMYGDGKILDLYSLQDAIPAANIGGYHGYAGRLGDLITSLRKVAAERPDLVIPSRGPIIRNPAETIVALISRIQAVYANYLSIDALRWYFRDDHILTKAKRVLGADAHVQWMPMAETTSELPSWIVPITNARLILSSDKAGFLVDCGSQQIIDQLQELRAAGKLASLEHVFVTHYHDDHTDQVAKLVQMSGATVHASRENWDILENPSAYRLPCLTRNPLQVSGRAASGAHWRWKEFDITLFYFPGQTLYHDALLVKKDGGEQVFFIGDSFTPAGIDDYCLLNRNFLHQGMGFFYCLDLLERAAPRALLINQHVPPAFRFSGEQREQLRQTLRQRVELLRSLLPWDDPNFGLDEGWARFYPYADTVRPGQTTRFSLRIMNHSPFEQTFAVKLNLPEGWSLVSMSPAPIRIPAREEGAVAITISLADTAQADTHILTADLSWDDWQLREWTEAMVTVSP